MLGKDTEDRLFEPGGLNDECLDIPQTIRDAILVTAEIGKQYLWVDALCIFQDSEEEGQSRSRAWTMCMAGLY